MTPTMLTQEVEPRMASDLEWGRPDLIGTPAFWQYYARLHQARGEYEPIRLGRTLVEEVAACVLCGHGVRAELGLAAYQQLKSDGLLELGTPQSVLERSLRKPLATAHGPARYRFPRQKAAILADVLKSTDVATWESLADLELRDRLLSIRGIGLKTASFIVRNYRASDAVAILDVHVVRAGRNAGVFAPSDDPARCYAKMEREFLAFAKAVGVRPGLLDNVMWTYGRELAFLLR